jgi:hypothetical protein
MPTMSREVGITSLPNPKPIASEIAGCVKTVGIRTPINEQEIYETAIKILPDGPFLFIYNTLSEVDTCHL